MKTDAIKKGFTTLALIRNIYSLIMKINRLQIISDQILTANKKAKKINKWALLVQDIWKSRLRFEKNVYINCVLCVLFPQRKNNPVFPENKVTSCKQVCRNNLVFHNHFTKKKKKITELQTKLLFKIWNWIIDLKLRCLSITGGC